MSILEDLGGPRLDVPSTDDLMHLSPDMDRHQSADEDIDIDLDIENDVSNQPEDEAMEEHLDDTVDQVFFGHQQSTAVNDDEMIDDEIPYSLHHDHTSLVDEDLEDAEDPLLDEDLEEGGQYSEQNPETLEGNELETNGVDVEDTAQSNSDEIQNYGGNPKQGLSDNAEQTHQGYPDIASHTSHTGGATITNRRDESAPEVPTEQSVGEVGQEEEAKWLGQENSVNQIHTWRRTPDAEQQTPDEPYVPSASAEIDNYSQPHQNNDEDNEIDASTDVQTLHPVIVVYQGNEMSLFPPIDEDTEESQTYFLDNEAYAGESLSNLFEHCRTVLADSISDEEELEIKISDLGLILSESSTDSTTATLSQIVDIFIQLSQHDGSENPGPMFIELYIKYKFTHRLEYLMTAVIEGKGFSQLKFLDGPESFSGDGEYVPDNENAAVGESDNANNDTTDLGADRAFNISVEKTLQGKGSDTEQVEGSVHGKMTPQRLDDVTAKPRAGVSAHFPVEAVTSGASQRESTPAQHPAQEVPAQTDAKLRGQAAIDDDDIIDYSDDEAVPEFSARSSTLQGDGLDEKTRDLPEAGHDPEDFSDYGAGGKTSTEVRSWEAVMGNSSQGQNLVEGLRATYKDYEDQEERSQSNPHNEEVDDLDHIVDYDEEDFERKNASQNEHENESQIDQAAADTGADAARTGDTRPLTSLANTNYDAHLSHTLTSDIDFGDDLENDSGDVAEDGATLGPEAISLKGTSFSNDDVSRNVEKTAGTGHEVHGNRLKQGIHPSTGSENHRSLENDPDEIVYDTDDEITIPDDVEPTPNSAVSPPSLKRLHSSHDEENVPNGTSPDCKRIRSA